MAKNIETNTALSGEEIEIIKVDKMLDGLATRFRRGEMPHTIDELREMADVVGAEGEERGFNNRPYDHFVDMDGGLVVVSRKEGEAKSSYDRPSEDKNCRIFADGRAVEVTVPPEWQQYTLQFHNGEMAPDAIYDVEGVDPAMLPDDMRFLVDKFGTNLSVETTPSLTNETMYIDEKAVGLDYVGIRIIQQEAELRQAEEAAHRVESGANAAAAGVKKNLFMSARKLAVLQDEAYKRSIRESTERRR